MEDNEVYATFVGCSGDIVAYTFLKQDAGGVRENWFMVKTGNLWNDYYEKTTIEDFNRRYRYNRISKEDYYRALIQYVKSTKP